MSALFTLFVWAVIIAAAGSAPVATLAVVIAIRAHIRIRRSERKAVRLIGPRAGDPATAGLEFRTSPRSWELNEDDIQFLQHSGVRA